MAFSPSADPNSVLQPACREFLLGHVPTTWGSLPASSYRSRLPKTPLATLSLLLECKPHGSDLSFLSPIARHDAVHGNSPAVESWPALGGQSTSKPRLSLCTVCNYVFWKKREMARTCRINHLVEQIVEGVVESVVVQAQ